MISKVALKIAEYYSEMQKYSREEIAIYKYGYELLISTFINFLCILIVSFLFHSIIGGILFCSAFIPLRTTAGGYHAKHHWSCILTFTLIFTIFSFFISFLHQKFMKIYIIISVVLALVFVLLFSPVEAINKHLEIDKRRKQRSKSVYISVGNVLTVLVLLSTDFINTIYKEIAYYCSGALAASISLLMAVFINGLQRNNTYD